MAVFKVTYTKNGKRGRSSKHYVEFKDHRKIRRRVPGFKDRKASERLLWLLEQLASCRHNKAQPGIELVSAIEAMTPKVRARLIEWGVLDTQWDPSPKSVADHLAEYRNVLEAKGVSSNWAALVYARALRVFRAAGCSTLAEISADKIIVAADAVRQAENLSNWTHNHCLAACKAFTRWATPERMNLDPLAKLKGRNARANRVHQRRALTAPECMRLIHSAEAGPVSWGVVGTERALIYRLALETGLRANEIRSLTRGAFMLDGVQPAVTVKARDTKNKKPALQPLRPVLVGLLRVHLANKLPTAPAFDMPASAHTAEMIRVDLASAGIEYEIDGAFADFHALRHTFISNLARAGVMPNIAKELARHSTITLTMDYYTHTRLGDSAAAVANLPDLDGGKAAQTA